MEIEAKYVIPDEETFQRLLEADTLAGFLLGSVSTSILHDLYLETKDGALRAGGYACRLRQTGNRTLATLKGLGGASGALHRRVELEVELPKPLPPEEWPSSAARHTLMRLCNDCDLVSLFEVMQTRHCRSLRDGDRTVAEISLNRVHVYQGTEMSTRFLELEAELQAAGLEEDLEILGSELEQAWGLTADSLTKYDRGLALTTGR